MLTPDVHEVHSALHESATAHDIESDTGCARCAYPARCRAAGACIASWGGTLSLVPGSPEHARKVAERAMLDVDRDEPCACCGYDHPLERDCPSSIAAAGRHYDKFGRAL